MTNTARYAKTAALSLAAAPVLSREAGESLVDQIVRSIQARIDDKLLRSGARMPSIRQFAETHRVSRFTVVEAYDRLVAQGFLESRRGSGFYVRERSPMMAAAGHAHAEEAPPQRIDVVWLVRNMFRQYPAHRTPGSGLLPNDWLDGELIANGLRAISRQNQSQLLQYGNPQGFLPLRQQLQLKLAELEIAATPDQIVTTSGITQALDIVARHFARPGDTIFVDDPAWFLMFGSFATLGANVIGIPRLPDGPDIAKLAELAALHKPKFYVINSVLHNPTSTSLSAAKAFQILKIAEQHDFTIVEDDIYCDLHPGSSVQPATRIASLDQLNRVIYLGGFSKTLAANLRVGFIATTEEMAKRLSDRKMLSTLTTSDIGERIVYKILSEGHYRKHVDRLRGKLDGVRDKMVKQLERVGLTIDISTPAGLFLWADTGRDTNVLTEKAMSEGILLAPGSLFSPSQLPSTRMRVNVASMGDMEVLRFLERELGRG
ncbi:PLP-dependent aminotransferase family protein [Noviherbaspirillum sp. CPCC 100848]|uniref:PLP-dependent aminotransferase family protein n=1 Tax=Noviherbaspirillum album TaxID=3080276 RepID=A0ABU6J8I2_9BURK|nr:PLP-dependent aminotransferase family protein [Noviherbaspirillum sp. CPCC 100848]MEC4719650.1 PLP-dependent aminotransferase family protein [Noviherbaspirillum sp. CPCC 100848]